MDKELDRLENEFVFVSAAFGRGVLGVVRIDLVRSRENGFADGPSCARIVYLIHLH